MNRSRNAQSSPQAGFSLFEITLVLVILSLLTGLVLPRVGAYQARARDARRIQDLGNLAEAIESFRRDLGRYPASPSEVAGWDTSADGDLAAELITERYWRKPLEDPLEDAGHSFHYRVYPQGENGCFGPGPYYVLGIEAFETKWARDRFQSTFRCSGFDWSSELEYTTGGGASFTAPGAPSGPGL